MRFAVRPLRIALTALLATGAIAVPSIANAAPAPSAVCTDFGAPAGATTEAVTPASSSPTYFHTSETSVYIGDTSTRIYGAPGGTLGIQKAKAWTASGSITGTTTADAGVVFANVSASVGVTVGLSRTTTTTVSYTWTVPTNVSSGWVEVGGHGYKITYDKGHYVSPCTWVSVQRNTVYGVTSNTYFMNSVAYPATPHK